MPVQVPLQIMAGTFSLFALHLPVRAYIPAIPTNDTAVAIANGLNMTETSRLNVEWGSSNPNSPGTAFETISYQVVGKNSNGTTKGVFVHFSEDDVTGAADDTTTTPWIALISCDANSTRASQSSDIFTLAYQRGALGALLYSSWSQACIIITEYKDSNSDNRPMDVFSTQSLASAQSILSLFSNLGDSADGEYNPSVLNASQAIVDQSLEEGTPAESGYLSSTLVAYNATTPSGWVSDLTLGWGSHLEPESEIEQVSEPPETEPPETEPPETVPPETEPPESEPPESEPPETPPTQMQPPQMQPPRIQPPQTQPQPPPIPGPGMTPSQSSNPTPTLTQDPGTTTSLAPPLSSGGGGPASGGVTSSNITLVMILLHVITMTGCIVGFYLL